MLVIGLTGGIGSGKTTVGKLFESLGIPVYSADQRAKDLYQESAELKTQVLELFGDKAYIAGELNRPFLAKKVFNDKILLNKLNSLVHPLVRKDFQDWKSKQSSKYVLREAAILFESNTYKDCDYVITVYAPVEERLRRVMLRDQADQNQVMSRINNQWTDEQRREKADFEIVNLDQDLLQHQVRQIHEYLINK
ncbi:MAG: dephospho-CoA kinase [Flavobacteriales bacterium]|nr:dephospho-CoA kinase [Flavobacteriales bacterium]